MLTIGIKVGITTGKFKCTSYRDDIENIEEEEGEKISSTSPKLHKHLSRDSMFT